MLRRGVDPTDIKMRIVTSYIAHYDTVQEQDTVSEIGALLGENNGT
jgi:hypothetical protein